MERKHNKRAHSAIAHSHFDSRTKNEVRLDVPNKFFRDWLAEHFVTQIEDVLSSIAHQQLKVCLIFLLTAITDASRSWLIYAFPPFIAVGFASRQSLYPTLAADLFHGKSFGAIIGTLALFIGAGAGIGPWLGGIIHDWSGSYYWAFWVAQAMTFASIIFIWMAGSRQR